MWDLRGALVAQMHPGSRKAVAVVTGGSVGKREPEGVRGSEVVGRGAQPVHRRAHCCCCPTAIQKGFATPDYGRQKQWGGDYG